MPVEITRVAEGDFDWRSDSGPAAVVRAIAAAADAADEAVNLNEEAQLHLKHRGLAGGRLVLAGEDGFALRHGDNLDLVVRPEARGNGVGAALATTAIEGGGRVSAWSHADHPAASTLGRRLGFDRVRDLWVMARSLEEPVEQPSTDADVTIRGYRPEDAEALVEINAHAFRQHPEQGHMSVEDFRERTEEDWFDAEGLLLAVDGDDRLLGFHWTKTHPEGYGEVYVVAVSPRAAGRGIGKVLTAAGLEHLRERGLPEVILYVEGDNAPAIAVYDATGFTHRRTEAQYLRR